MRDGCAAPGRWLRSLAIAAVLAWWGCGDGQTPASPTPPLPGADTDSLKARGSAAGKLVGAAVQAGFLADPRYRAVVDREFDYLTAEYQMKWDVIETSRAVRNFSAGDAILDYADSHGARVKGHALIWHGSVPAWVNPLSAAELQIAFADHIREVGEHYRGRLHAWDVVNEAIADDGSLRDTVFRQKLGDGYIAEAFRRAREADPHALLFYNDYGGEGMGSKSNRIYELVRGLRTQGVPIDGIGLQMHISANNRPSDSSIAANMRRLADLGLVVHISEMDVRINSVSGTPQARLDAQKSTYHNVVRVCVMEPRCGAVTFWGFTDAHTWISGDMPLLYDAQYARKPAYFGVLDALAGVPAS